MENNEMTILFHWANEAGTGTEVYGTYPRTENESVWSEYTMLKDLEESWNRRHPGAPQSYEMVVGEKVYV